MSPTKYTIGIDFGTESARAVLVDLADGREIAEAVHPYADGVIDERIPGTNVVLEPDTALQNPDDYVAAVKTTVPKVLAASGVSPDDVIGIGIDFTACTMLPAKADGTPLCDLPEYHDNPHAWVKLWKHHAAQPEATASTKWPASAARPGFRATAARSRRNGSFPRCSRSSTTPPRSMTLPTA
jgi:L-ribulokinase